MFYLYILYSDSSDKYYVGYTDNVERRWYEHNNGERTTYTSKHRPWALRKSIALNDNRGFAMKIEKAIKRLKSRIIIEKIISEVNNVEDLARLVRVPMHRD
ncbi:MAG: GIY-YIG nuclease family protein [Pedobacter sp.]|nr:MAG: GIY-YIG nuclease family protein [Pedobacter sp.]